jgi:hypothetical protein
MLLEALRRFGARASRTPFIGDQRSDLEAAHRAGCLPVLVLTGLGRQVLAKGIPSDLHAVVFPDLRSAVEVYLRGELSVTLPPLANENQSHQANSQGQSRDHAQRHRYISRGRNTGTDVVFTGLPSDVQRRDRQAEKPKQNA